MRVPLGPSGPYWSLCEIFVCGDLGLAPVLQDIGYELQQLLELGHAIGTALAEHDHLVRGAMLEFLGHRELFPLTSLSRD